MDASAFLRRFAILTAAIVALDGLLEAVLPPLLSPAVLIPPFGVIRQVLGQSSTWLLAAALLALLVMMSDTGAHARRWGLALPVASGVALVLVGAALLSGRDGVGVLPAPPLRALVQTLISGAVLVAGLWRVGQVVRGTARTEA